ncbi:hypothetical protein AWZ03_005832 [Drosophila navojoa]|uniref:Shugoshin C-terminal domain-containing protein n=1 Tax=Drosophila navojoa TaxID=7232 RepID=A0A484BG22_DRONA|nr:histone-lysine N-methyltransferase, H3 lysine-79 specific isoform X2 [Drosophila navojoa]TDG47688.1 hypothetical protein AWZ03_005832 [Drosophila navojoa]
MDDLLGVMQTVSKLHTEMEAIRKTHFEELDQLFFGIASAMAEVKITEVAAATKPSNNSSNSSITPQQTKKRAKRLTSLAEDDGDAPADVPDIQVSQRQSARLGNAQLLAAADEEQDEEVVNTTGTLMPPPPAPAAIAAETSMSSGRPQRAAKLRSEKNLKEPPLNVKLRRPSNEEMVKIKLESEQRASQMHTIKLPNVPTEESVAAKAPAPAAVGSKAKDNELSTTNLRVKVKREKMSNDNAEATTTTLESTKTLTNESTILSTTTTTANSTTTTKKGRKKKETHKPIKVERLSDLDKNLPIASRTRRGSNNTRNSQESQTAAAPQASIYEDAVEDVPTAAVPTTGVVMNETVTLPNATFDVNMPTSNATMCLGDNLAGNATFQVESEKDNSMKTAREENSLPDGAQDTSLLTEDESLHEPAKPKVPEQPIPKSLKGIKLPARTHELFNPLMQSPVKMRVEAFENAAQAQSNLRSKRIKDAGVTGSSTTPVIGKLQAPTLGRFLTPTQSSTAILTNSAQPKKAPMSACKATTLLKTATGTNLKSANSGSNKTLTRENSGEDFRKGLHQLAEERKKQREQKHLQAAQLREAKERERAERMAKLAKEREEKRLKKQQEKLLEERKRMEMEELQRKLNQQEEAERLKKAKAKEQEREMLAQMKLQQQLQSAKAKKMMPPPPKSKYTFEMLHEDDSTDDEGKVSYKRPPVPTWSRSHVRGAGMILQTFCPTDIIDSFFSVAPQTPDLKNIFPNIDPSHLKRNSSVLWSTPPRYSELPKY